MATAKDLIRKIQLHEDLKEWVIQQLQAEGIECQEQDFYEENGDILIVKIEDVPRALAVIQGIKDQLNESVY
ncbi:hypothetical protein [Limnofasciculus baicalensis]|uniref:Uncharacterized protein n=1 Tax=Limnofasciculus baicalensis BBK-W-15 TaxID=2699891 RepID=A0AAE3KMR6_9CYAN|nr:hypothetical protein [Limnofasciculus baicalensis]MCP2727903.1 hypothetical protein [Limnofasciculus baicalensis BBK-W-15]